MNHLPQKGRDERKKIYSNYHHCRHGAYRLPGNHYIWHGRSEKMNTIRPLLRMVSTAVPAIAAASENQTAQVLPTNAPLEALNRQQPPQQKQCIALNPLTGLPVEDPENLLLPPALVSVTNFPVSARPQAGLSFSPIVFELFIGEGMTRYLALFYGDYPRASLPDQGEDGPG